MPSRKSDLKKVRFFKDLAFDVFKRCNRHCWTKVSDNKVVFLNLKFSFLFCYYSNYIILVHDFIIHN